MYKELLEQEMKKSDEFSRTNFGKQVGPDYPEIVKDVLKNESLSAVMLLDLVKIGMYGGKNVSESMKGKESDPSFKMGDAILANMDIFATPLSLFYWGVQIGRKLERESKEVNELEKLFGEGK